MGLEQEWHNILSFFFTPVLCQIYRGMVTEVVEGSYLIKEYSSKNPNMYSAINSDNEFNIMMPLIKETPGKIKFLR